MAKLWNHYDPDWVTTQHLGHQNCGSVEKLQADLEVATKRDERARGRVTGKFTHFPVCVIRNIFIRKLSHLTISSPFISINQKMHKNHSSF